MTGGKSIKTSKKTVKKKKLVERGPQNTRIDQYFTKNSSSDFKKLILEDNSVASRNQCDR